MDWKQRLEFERRKRRGGAGSRGPLLGLPGRDGGDVGLAHVAAGERAAAAADAVRPGRTRPSVEISVFF